MREKIAYVLDLVNTCKWYVLAVGVYFVMVASTTHINVH